MMHAMAEAGAGTGEAAGVELVDLYREHYASLVRLASLLLHDVAAAEDVTQDAFAKVHLAWGRIREPEKALAYVRSAVLNGARSQMRHLHVVDRHRPEPRADTQSAEARALSGEEHREVVAALRALPTAPARVPRAPLLPRACPRRRSPRRSASRPARSRPTPTAASPRSRRRWRHPA